MARIILPTTIDGIKKLLEAIIAEHTRLGTDSPLPFVLAQNNIDLNLDLRAVQDALTLDNAAFALSVTAKHFTEARNIKTEPAMKTIAGIVQVLKSSYKKMISEVGKWGVIITTTGKVTYPTSAADRLKLAKDIRTKHASFAPDPSPITPYLTVESINLDTLVTALEAAANYDEQATTSAHESENDIEQRDILMAPVNEHIAIIADFLMDLYKNKPREAGFFGFNVDESKQKPTEQITKVDAGDKKTISAVIIHGTLTNMGPGDAHVYKGKTTTGNPIIVPPGGKITIQKGFSTITVSNPSNLNPVTIKVLRSK